MYLNHLAIPKKDLFDLMTKSARKAVAGILAYHRDCIHSLNASDCFTCRLGD